MTLPIATNLYQDNEFQLPGVKLLPNELYTTNPDQDMVLATVLGSCVSACLYDPVLRLGGMNHFMLPDDGNDASLPASEAMRYGAYAMEMLVNALLKGGARRERLEAKVFGGGAVIKGMTTLNVGTRNAVFVRRYLDLEGIRRVAEDLEGPHPRKVVFRPRTGEVRVRKLKQPGFSMLATENALAHPAATPHGLAAEKARGRLELFGPRA